MRPVTRPRRSRKTPRTADFRPPCPAATCSGCGGPPQAVLGAARSSASSHHHLPAQQLRLRQHRLHRLRLQIRRISILVQDPLHDHPDVHCHHFSLSTDPWLLPRSWLHRAQCKPLISTGPSALSCESASIRGSSFQTEMFRPIGGGASLLGFVVPTPERRCPVTKIIFSGQGTPRNQCSAHDRSSLARGSMGWRSPKRPFPASPLHRFMPHPPDASVVPPSLSATADRVMDDRLWVARHIGVAVIPSSHGRADAARKCHSLDSPVIPLQSVP